MAKTQSGSLPKLRLNSQSIIWPLSSFKSVIPRCSHWSTSCVSHHNVVGTVGKHPPANRTVQRISMPLRRYLTTKSASHSNSAGCGVSSCLGTGFGKVNCSDNHACPYLDARTLIIKAVLCKGGRDLAQLCAGNVPCLFLLAALFSLQCCPVISIWVLSRQWRGGAAVVCLLC